MTRYTNRVVFLATHINAANFVRNFIKGICRNDPLLYADERLQDDNCKSGISEKSDVKSNTDVTGWQCSLVLADEHVSHLLTLNIPNTLYYVIIDSNTGNIIQTNSNIFNSERGKKYDHAIWLDKHNKKPQRKS